MVPDDHAGRLVRCPKCPAVLQVPLQPAPEQVLTLKPGENFELDLGQFDFHGETNRESPPGDRPPPPPAPGGGDLAGLLAQYFLACRVNRAGIGLLCVALGCLFLLVIFILLPWNHVWHPDQFRRRTWVGLLTAGGALSFFLTLAVLGFFVTVVSLRHLFLFEFALWALAGWGVLSFLWRLIEIIAAFGSDGDLIWSAGLGLYLSLAVSLGAAGTAGFVAVYRLVGQVQNASDPGGFPNNKGEGSPSPW